MSSFKKRKINGDSSTERRLHVAKSLSSEAKKPVQPPSLEPESNESENQEEDETDAQKTQSNQPDSNDQVTKTFADLGIREELCDACEALKYKHATPIQVEAIPLALEGRDVIGLAETGSGKTAAFVLPILQALLEKPQALFGLILAPTRELAYQIAQQVDALGSIINVKSAILVGGMDMVPQSIALSKKPHIVVATPGMCL